MCCLTTGKLRIDLVTLQVEQPPFKLKIKNTEDNCHHIYVSVVEWLKYRTDDQHGLGSKTTCTILLCPWERHSTPLSPA